MPVPHPLIGFRKDRLGARFIALLDMLRLSQKFDLPARFVWLSQPGGPYPELIDPTSFFTKEFVEENIEIVTDVPALGDRRALSSVAQINTSDQFRAAIQRGERFYSGGIIEVTRFSDEAKADVTEEIRQIVRALPLAPRLKNALNRARREIAKIGDNASAIHVRRGDILDADPWSYRAWPSKYVPDDFFQAFIAQHDGPVLAFSDTPDAVTHLAKGNPRVLPVHQLIGHARLTPPERDLLELLLMSECEDVGAPGSSAFSLAAAVVGGVTIRSLPAALPEEVRIASYDALIVRVINAPDSFFAPGDLAQSLVYAAQHAINSGQAETLLDGFRAGSQFYDRFPFVRYWMALVALAAGRQAEAHQIASQAVDNERLRKAERQSARQILELTASRSEGTIDEAAFLTATFDGPVTGGPLTAHLAQRLMSQPSRVSEVLMFPPELARLLSMPEAQGMGGALAENGQGMVLPGWTYLSEWPELVSNVQSRDQLIRFPFLAEKLAIGQDLLAALEPELTEGRTPPAPDAEALLRLGFCAAMLGLHGRFKRAFALLHWLDKLQPDQPMTHKRLADNCFRVGNAKAGMRWLTSAITLAPENPLLRLSLAERFIALGELPNALAALERGQMIWPELGMARVTRRNYHRKLASLDKGPVA